MIEKGTEDVCTECGHLYLRLPHATSGKCCRCRGGTSHGSCDVEHRREVIPGAFTSQAQLDAWYDNDKLRCHICGEEHAGLYRHVGMAHGVDTREYKKMYGIPMTYGLSGKATREKHRQSAANTIEQMKATGFKNLEKGRKARKEGSRKRTTWTAYQLKDHMARLIESPNHPSNLEGDVEVVCTQCGTEFPVAATIALQYQCKATCPSCKKPRNWNRKIVSRATMTPEERAEFRRREAHRKMGPKGLFVKQTESV